MQKKSRLLFAIALWLIGAGIYSNTFDNQFVFDDFPGIVENYAIRDIANLKVLEDYYRTRFVGFYTFALNYHFHQTNPWGYHAVNLFIHLINTLLVWWFVLLVFETPRMKGARETKDKEYLAFFIALIFLTHPIQTQAVTYVYQRLASLATLFYFLSVCLYINGKIRPQRRAISFMGMAVSAVLGMMTKEIVFTLPFAIILIEDCFFKTPATREKKTPGRWKYFLPILFFTLIIPFLCKFQTSYIFSTRIRLSNDHSAVTSWNYLLTQFSVIVTYLRLLIFPIGQSLDHDFSLAYNFFEPRTFFSFIFLTSIFLTATRLLKKYPLIAFGIFWFFLTLLVESSIIPIRHVIFEHRLYLPMLGFCIVLCAGLYYSLKDLRKVTVVIAIITVIFSILTYQRNQVWQDPITFWSDVVKKSPNQAQPYDNLASAYLAAGDFDKALTNLEHAIQLDPQNAESYNNLGLVYLNTDRLDQAIEQFTHAIALREQYAVPYNNLGVALARKKDFASAEKYFVLSSQISKNYLDAYLNLADVYRRTERLQEAIDLYQEILRQNPSKEESLFALAEIYLEKKDHAQAEKMGQEIIKKVNDAAFLTTSGSLFAKNNLNEMALELYSKALAKNPKNKLTYIEMGKLYGNLGYFEQAIGIWEEGRQLYPDEPQFLYLIQAARGLMNTPQLPKKNH